MYEKVPPRFIQLDYRRLYLVAQICANANYTATRRAYVDIYPLKSNISTCLHGLLVMNGIMEDIIESASFQPHHFVIVLEYCYQYGRQASILKAVMGYITNYYTANSVEEDGGKDALYNAQCLQINVLVWVLR